MEKKNLEYTLSEAHQVLQDYLNAEKSDLVVGTQAYYEYLLNLLMYGADEKLKEHPRYELILDYASVYLAETQKAVEPEQGESTLYKMKEGLIETSFCRTIGDLAE